MYLKYQQSLKDNPYMAKNHINRKLRPITDDIFSQMPVQDTSYAMDSFCVPDNHASIYESELKYPKKHNSVAQKS
jgi:hypothetical protein